MSNSEKVYLNALRDILENGDDRPDRTGVGTRSIFGLQMRFDLRIPCHHHQKTSMEGLC